MSLDEVRGTDETSRGHEQLVDCSSIAAHGSMALDGSLPLHVTSELAQHVRTCRDCATYLDQMATTSAIVGARAGRALGSTAAEGLRARAESNDPQSELARTQRVLMKLARAADPAHADDLVQETWDHFLSESSTTVPARGDLTQYLLDHLENHERDEDAAAAAWADSLLEHHAHNAADLAESDQPSDPASYESLRTLADLDVLDPDADSAELYFPDLYDDGPDKGEWVSPPTAWPSVSRVLGPDDELQTEELYSVVDGALDQLPDGLDDALYLVDIEGHSLEMAGSLLGRKTSDVQRDLARARNHVRGLVNEYLSGR